MNHSAPSPNPATNRAAANSGMFCASPEASVPIAYNPIAIPSALSRPMRSASSPTRNEQPRPARKIAKKVRPQCGVSLADTPLAGRITFSAGTSTNA